MVRPATPPTCERYCSWDNGEPHGGRPCPNRLFPVACDHRNADKSKCRSVVNVRILPHLGVMGIDLDAAGWATTTHKTRGILKWCPEHHKHEPHEVSHGSR